MHTGEIVDSSPFISDCLDHYRSTADSDSLSNHYEFQLLQNDVQVGRISVSPGGVFGAFEDPQSL